MPRVYLSLGSNIDRERHIRAALQCLGRQFMVIDCSRVYESAAIGFDGDSFYNLVVGLDTELPVGELSAFLKRIEDEQGRDRSGPRFSSRTLDIDILTYGHVVGMVDGVELPRAEMLHNAFVLWPLAELAAEESHPVECKTYGQLWRDFDKSSQQLWPVELRLDNS